MTPLRSAESLRTLWHSPIHCFHSWQLEKRESDMNFVFLPPTLIQCIAMNASVSTRKGKWRVHVEPLKVHFIAKLHTIICQRSISQRLWSKKMLNSTRMTAKKADKQKEQQQEQHDDSFWAVTSVDHAIVRGLSGNWAVSALRRKSDAFFARKSVLRVPPEIQWEKGCSGLPRGERDGCITARGDRTNPQLPA